MDMKKRRIGIMGGTFDPIHIGHLITAETIRVECHLDRVLFIPAGSPPHKQGQCITPGIHRYQMTVLATDSNPHFQVLPMEIDRSGLSYTIDTVRMLLDQFGADTELFCIIGADAIRDLLTWRELDTLLDLCWLVVASRPGSLEAIGPVISQLGEKGRERILRLETPQMEISATLIRDRLRRGLSVRYLVSECVEEYIYKEALYTVWKSDQEAITSRSSLE